MKSQHGNTIPPTNKTVALRTCFIMDFENGQCKSFKNYNDLLFLVIKYLPFKSKSANGEVNDKITDLEILAKLQTFSTTFPIPCKIPQVLVYFVIPLFNI